MQIPTSTRIGFCTRTADINSCTRTPKHGSCTRTGDIGLYTRTPIIGFYTLTPNILHTNTDFCTRTPKHWFVHTHRRQWFVCVGKITRLQDILFLPGIASKGKTGKQEKRHYLLWPAWNPSVVRFRDNLEDYLFAFCLFFNCSSVFVLSQLKGNPTCLPESGRNSFYQWNPIIL